MTIRVRSFRALESKTPCEKCEKHLILNYRSQDACFDMPAKGVNATGYGIGSKAGLSENNETIIYLVGCVRSECNNFIEK